MCKFYFYFLLSARVQKNVVYFFFSCWRVYKKIAIMDDLLDTPKMLMVCKTS